MSTLKGTIALVAGGTRGAGRGIAAALGVRGRSRMTEQELGEAIAREQD